MAGNPALSLLQGGISTNKTRMLNTVANILLMTQMQPSFC